MDHLGIDWRTEQRKLRDLAEWEKNPRQLSKHDAEHIRRSIEKFGLADPLVVNANGQIIGGHQRKRILLALEAYGPDAVVDVRIPSRALDAREVEELNVRLNRNSGSWDFDILSNEFDVDDLLDWGFTDFDLEMGGIELDEEEPPENPGAQIDRASELQEKWGTELGQVWELGEHRVVCGDCTDAAVVEAVMRGEMIDSVVTDPPYGVGYDGGTTERDKLKGDESPALYFPFLQNARDVCASHAALYLFYADGDATVTQAVTQAGYTVRNTLIWNKSQAQFGALSAQYKQKHEPFLYCHLRGESPQWFGPTNEVTVWDIQRASKNELHPTQKPVELIERVLKNSTLGGDVVLDGFLGSGTTLIACERLGRKCCGIEIEPKYIAVTLERWADMTGREPKLVEG